MPAMNIYTPRLIYYVYAYLRKDGTPYYIGKGKGKRAWEKHNHRSIPKEQTKIIILEAKLTEIGALALERRMIRWYGRKDSATGILRNLTDGGDGTSGGICSAETKKKISEANKGRNKGRILSSETRKKLSEAGKSRKGHIHSVETRKKMSKAGKGRILSAETRKKMSESQKGHGRIHSAETRRKMAETRSKIWFFIDPNGNEFPIKNLTKFCRENNLGQTEMCRVAKGKKESYKGWMKF
jgi:hypothetical protein